MSIIDNLIYMISNKNLGYILTFILTISLVIFNCNITKLLNWKKIKKQYIKIIIAILINVILFSGVMTMIYLIFNSTALYYKHYDKYKNEFVIEEEYEIIKENNQYMFYTESKGKRYINLNVINYDSKDTFLFEDRGKNNYYELNDIDIYTINDYPNSNKYACIIEDRQKKLIVKKLGTSIKDFDKKYPEYGLFSSHKRIYVYEIHI